MCIYIYRYRFTYLSYLYDLYLRYANIISLITIVKTVDQQLSFFPRIWRIRFRGSWCLLWRAFRWDDLFWLTAGHWLSLIHWFYFWLAKIWKECSKNTSVDMNSYDLWLWMNSLILLVKQVFTCPLPISSFEWGRVTWDLLLSQPWWIILVTLCFFTIRTFISNQICRDKYVVNELEAQERSSLICIHRDM